jgi:hypothetical protein
MEKKRDHVKGIGVVDIIITTSRCKTKKEKEKREGEGSVW